MQRRDFLKIMGAGGAGVIMMPSLLTGCSSTPESALAPWQGPNPDTTDIRLQTLSYGLLAANPHNIQPWLIRLEAPRQFSLFVDPERLLPETDPVHRQIHIGQGTFLENVSIAAGALGYVADISLFPEGEYNNSTLEDLPVAHVHLRPSDIDISDPLFDAILDRQTNKRPYTDEPVRATERSSLRTLANYPLARGPEPDFALHWHWFDTDTEREAMTELIGQAMAVEVSDHDRHLETWRLFRFNEEEVERYRDGFSYGNNGITGLRRWLVERLYSRESARDSDSSWAQFPVDQHYEIAASAPLFGALSTTGNTRRDQVLLGRHYQRLNLAATRLGIAIHPHSQILQEYPDMASLQARLHSQFGFGENTTVQMLYRMGYADPVDKTPRRALADLWYNS
ncbi:twin-arginine translocation pathway signal protein [Natronospirillum operosum]|uniref:Twin-arginine translocation pathway signal protein n=1 Tax=Natronospirillum operosum TaxID=2759953 RepID=A0A4Z0W4I6_9GAMM|nr:twin-arginine translocation pathway signal protein [Natronospirillum operosum]TGG92427.1 twin-arginine translocation pathway signal protein [Natronospirillum operosum]